MLTRLFLDHPRSVNETYWQHMAFALRFSAGLLGASLAALLHAFIPCCFEKTASRHVAKMYQRTRYRGAVDHSTEAPPGQALAMGSPKAR